MSVEISELILEKSGAADELKENINSWRYELGEEQRMTMFAEIQPLLHKAINATIEYMKEREVK